MAETKKRRKPRALRKEEVIRLRCTGEQKETLTEAAMKAGLGLSGWLLMVGLRASKAEGGGGE
jgi:hypothetical protein